VRVLLVNDWVADPGGVETYLFSLRDGLQGRGDEVKLLTSSVGSAANGSAEYVARGARRRLPQVGMQLVNPFAAAQARAAVQQFRPDVALVSMFEMHLSPAVIAALRPTPTILNVGYYKPVCPNGLKLWPNGTICTEPAGLVCWRSGCLSFPHWLRDQARYALIHRAVRRAAAIVTCSEWMERELERGGVVAQRLEWPVSGPAAGFDRRRSPDPLFVYTGRLSPEKGVRLLLRAFGRLRTKVAAAQLRVVGDGPERTALERLAPEGVTFTGRVEPGEIDQQLADAWALVAPSLWAEPFGLVAAEAIVRGLPVIASSTGGFAETVEPGVTGLLFPNGDEDALVDRLETIATGRAFDTEALSAEAVDRVRVRHDLARHVDRLRSLFAEVAA
jgi:glycosyltransferase involved in cell wall biosynthesis